MNRSRLLIISLIFLTVFITHIKSKVQTSADSRWSVPTAMSIKEERNIDLDEYAYLIEQDDYYAIQVIDGHLYNFFPVGPAVIALPFVWVIDWFVDKAAGMDYEDYLQQNRAEDTEEFIASFIVALTAVIIFLIARAAGLNTLFSLLIAFIFSFCTPAWSTASRALWQHGPSMFMLASTIYLFVKAEREPRWARFAGVPLACAFLIRPTNIIPCVLFMLLVFIKYRKYFYQSLSLAVAIMIPFVVLNLHIYGSVLAPYYSASRIGLGPHVPEALVGNLVSPNRGIFIWSPVLLFSFYGMSLNLKNHRFRKLDITIICIIVLHWILISLNPPWWAGGCVGPRFFTDIIPCFIYFLLPVPGSIVQPAKTRLILGAAFVILTGFSFFTHYMGANNLGIFDWIGSPENIDKKPSRVWDWHDLQFLRKHIKDGKTPQESLMIAAANGYTDEMEVLLNQGVNVNTRDRGGWTALMWAANKGHTESVRRLLDAGAEVNAKNPFGLTALMFAAKNGHIEIVETLLDEGADVHPKGKKLGETALMRATKSGHAEIARMLRDAGAEK